MTSRAAQGLCGGSLLPLDRGLRPGPPPVWGVIVSRQHQAGDLARIRGHPATHHTGRHSHSSFYTRGREVGWAQGAEDGAPARPRGPGRQQSEGAPRAVMGSQCVSGAAPLHGGLPTPGHQERQAGSASSVQSA